MKKLGKVAKLIRINWKTMAGFELLYKVLSLTVFTPLFWGMFNGIMKITGYAYLTKENVLSFLGNPVTLATLIVLFFCMAVYTMTDIGAVIFLLEQSRQGVRVNLKQTVKFAARNAVRVFHFRNVAVIFVVLFLIPFLNLGVTSGYISSISVPEFILDFIMDNGVLAVLFTAVLIGLSVLLFRWLYAFHYFTLEGCDFKEARRKSAALSRKNKSRDIAVLLGIQLFFCVCYFILAVVGVFLAIALGGLFTEMKLIGIVSSSVVWVFLAVIQTVVSALGTPVSYACISILFYGHKEERKEEIVSVPAVCEPAGKKRRIWTFAAEAVLFACSVALCSFYLYGVSNHMIGVPVEHLGTMEVTAHRGASRLYPENTMAAFEGAKELGADWIELDVQQSRDGQIFVMHDANLKRTTGVDRNTWELDYEEIRTLDAGSFFNESFAGERAPLLTEVIAFAKENGIKLNIELKPSGMEVDFEKNVVLLIMEADFADSCVITSQVYEVLENVKACNEKVETVYVMSLAYGDVNRLAAADHFSIEATSVTEKMVSDVHNAGKQLFVWTVNTEANMNRMIELGVDNIITDDVTLAKECIFYSKTSDLFAEYAKWLSELGEAK